MRIATGTTRSPRRLRLTLLAAVLALFGLVAASCGSSSTEIETSDSGADVSADVDNESSSTDASGSSDSSSSDSSSSSSDAKRESPIGDLLGIPVSDDDAMEEYFGQLQRDAEQKIAECMRGEGFEYTPVDYSAFDGSSIADFESREFAEQQGFGAAPFPSGEMEELIQDFTDPNNDYLLTLTEGERDAYQAALRGELPDFDPTSDDEFIFEPAGCQGEAYEAVFSFGQVFEEFNDEFESMEDNFEADPRIVEARGDWSRCMADAGFSYSTPDEAREQFSSRYERIMRNPDVFEAPEIDLDNPPQEGDIFASPSLKPEYRAEVDGILAEEVKAAVASWDCTEPVKEIEREVQVEIEQEFVDTFGDQIRAALDGA